MSVGIALFGTQNYLCYLEDVEIKGKQGEQLALCYKYSIHCFFLPLWWTRDGYVLGKIETNAEDTKSWIGKSFYPLTEEKITRGEAHPAVPGWSICSMRVPCAGDQRRTGGDMEWLGRDR
jgi:hypothetical protein